MGRCRSGKHYFTNPLPGVQCHGSACPQWKISVTGQTVLTEVELSKFAPPSAEEDSFRGDRRPDQSFGTYPSRRPSRCTSPRSPGHFWGGYLEELPRHQDAVLRSGMGNVQRHRLGPSPSTIWEGMDSIAKNFDGKVLGLGKRAFRYAMMGTINMNHLRKGSTPSPGRSLHAQAS